MGGDFTPLFLIILSLSSKYVMLDGMIHSIDSSFCYENEVFEWFSCYLARELSKHALAQIHDYYYCMFLLLFYTTCTCTHRHVDHTTRTCILEDEKQANCMYMCHYGFYSVSETKS